MIPYIEVKDKNSITCSADLIIMDSYSNPLLISLTDIQIRNKKVIADIISNNYNKTINIRDREDNTFTQSIRANESKFNAKSDKLGDDLTHTVIISNMINNYCINWNNEDEAEFITKCLQNKHFIPITKDIVNDLILNNKYKDNIISYTEIYTNNPMFKNLKCFNINITWVKEILQKINTEEKYDFDNYDWDKIITIEDYLFTFLNPIKNKLQEQIKVLYDPNNINQKIFEGKKKPFDGQIPLIQSGIEVLKRNKSLYLAAEQGIGKTILSTKINHIYMSTKDKTNYTTLIVAPAITIKQWEEELKDGIKDKINIQIIKKTDDFIKIYNENNNLKFDKPTYFIVGKETFKLMYKKKAGVVIKKLQLKYKKKVETTYSWQNNIQTKEEIITVCVCPDCGIPLRNELIKTEDRFFSELDFTGSPKKSNYKCNKCNAVLWQGTYDKTKKTSLINFIKIKNIKFDSIIFDEIHESNNGESIIGCATRTLFNYTKKILLLSGTSNNGYASSLYNILLGLFPRKLLKDEVLDGIKGKENFIKKYGTLKATTKVNDGSYYRSGRTQVKDSEFKEIEGINPQVFTKYFVENYIFATLDDLGKDLPELKERYIATENTIEMEKNERYLFEDIKKVNAFNAKMYLDSIVRHYTNNPFSWSGITITSGDNTKEVQPRNINDKTILLEKEKKLIELIKQEKKENRKCWIYTDFTGESGTGQYMQGKNIPERLKGILEKEGLKVFWLKPNVAPIDRKELIEKNKDKYDVFISNPKLVQVGINMVWCSTYIVYMPSYHINVIDQAVRRGMRANSTEENRIFYLYYKNSIEKEICERMQLKKAESKAIEAKFNFEVNINRTASAMGKRINDGIKK